VKVVRIGAVFSAVLMIAACSGGASPSVSSAPTAAPATSAPSDGTGSPAASQAAGPGAPEKTTIKIVQGSSPDYTQIALTKSLEYLEERGITAEFQSVDDTDVATRAVIAGQADVVVNSLFFGMNAVKEGIPLVTILADAQTLDYLLVSVPDITDPKQLENNGKMGINQPGDLGATVADQCLKFADVDVTKVEFVQVGGTGARMAALVAGAQDSGSLTIHAAPAHAAEALAAQEEAGLNILANCGEQIGSFLQTGATVTQDFLTQNPNLAQHFVDAYLDALRWAQENKDEYIELSKEVLPDMPDELRAPAYDVFTDVDLFAVNGGLNAESVQKLTDIGLDAGSIEEPVPDNWYTMDLIESYLARNGEMEQ
jgi:ABC-type nitrate/sulfonate/bicarbonate transport system substrate-binding protein